jgi:hypothetical protein
MFLDASYKNEEINNKNNIAITNIKQRKISMSGITTRGNLNSSDPYNLYYDINVVTDYDPTLTGDTSPALTFTETRQNPIINYPEDYLLSVVRFTLDSPTLPIWSPDVLLGQGNTNPNKLIYSFAMKVVDYAVPAAPVTYYQTTPSSWIFIPDDLTLPPPTAPFVFQNLQDPYYYVYEFSKALAIMNNALKASFTAMNAVLTANLQPVIGNTSATPSAIFQNYCPQMTYDPNQELFSINFPLVPPALATVAPPYTYDTYDQNLPLNNANVPGTFTGRVISLYMNTPAYILLNSIPTRFQGNDIVNLTRGTEYEIVAYNNQYQNTTGGSRPTFPLTPVSTATASIPQITVPQENSTTILWSPVQSLVFSTSLLPVQNTLLSKPVIFNFWNGTVSKPVGGNSNNNVTAPVLTDFELQGATGTSSQVRITYTPTAEYRMLDLRGTTPVNAVEVSVFWKDKFSNLHRFQLGVGCVASIKILFRRKDFYNARVD